MGILITNSLGLADSLARETYDLKRSVIDAGSGNIFKRIIDYSNKNPWLYAVYVVLVGLPTVLIITFCCSGGEKPAASKSDLNDPKKTDEVQEDDVVEDEAPNDGEEPDDAEDEGSAVEDEEGEDEEEEETDEPPTTRSQTRNRRKPRKD